MCPHPDDLDRLDVIQNLVDESMLDVDSARTCSGQVADKALEIEPTFRVAFDNKNVAESFARENLPGEITNQLDFSSMTQDKDTFVDQKLSRCYSDVLYHIQFKNNPAYLYFLFEHKSWEPDFPGVQLLKNNPLLVDE